MLLTGFTKDIFRPECNASFQSLNCIAHLKENIGEVIPYLNTVFGGTRYIKDPPSVMFKINGRLISVHADKISINALNSIEEADKLLFWLQREINDIWERRNEIEPTDEVPDAPIMIEVLKLLPKTNCRKCGQPTCMVFSTLVIQGVKGADDCPELTDSDFENLREYLSKFQFAD
jgi:ArsR family metal-binding transcriptional regulator